MEFISSTGWSAFTVTFISFAFLLIRDLTVSIPADAACAVIEGSKEAICSDCIASSAPCFAASLPIAPGICMPAIPSREKTVSVTGSATSSVDPDVVNIYFGVEVEAVTAKEAVSANSAAMTAVIDAINNLGISDDEISTSSFNIYPVYTNEVDPKTGVYVKSEVTGYKVSNILSVKTTKLNMAGSIIDAAVDAGANRVDSIYYSLSPEKQTAVQDELIEEAVLNAKSKAEKAISPLGQKIIGVKAVSMSDFGYPPPIPFYGGVEKAMLDSSTPIFSSDQDVTTTVSVMFLIGEQ